MNASEEIKKELDSLVKMLPVLLDLIKEEKNFITFGDVYQKWYSRAYKVLQYLAPERLEEFTSYYFTSQKRKIMQERTYVIQDYIQGYLMSSGHTDLGTSETLRRRLINQIQILGSIASRIDGVLQDIRGNLFAELQDAELATAAELKKVSLIASGAVAGVVLEAHLQQIAQNHKVSIGNRKPTIANLNDSLRLAGIYDMPTSRKIQMLADIRALCVHKKKTPPTADQIDDMLSGVDRVIKNVF